jgi:hypothetical protein
MADKLLSLLIVVVFVAFLLFMWNAIPFGQRIYASDRPGPEKVACDTRNDELSCSSSGERGAESVEEDTEVVATVTCDEFYYSVLR